MPPPPSSPPTTMHDTRTDKLAQGNIAVSVFKFAGELIAMFSMDRVGRKPLFVSR
jgi:hypothetical protein